MLELVANLGVNGYTSRDVIEAELPRAWRAAAGVRDAAHRRQRRRPGRSGGDLRAECRRSSSTSSSPRSRRTGSSPSRRPTTPSRRRARRTATRCSRPPGSGATTRSCLDLATARGIAFVDIHDLSLRAATDRSLVADDGLHPSGAQYALWVDRIAPVVREALYSSRPGGGQATAQRLTSQRPSSRCLVRARQRPPSSSGPRAASPSGCRPGRCRPGRTPAAGVPRARIPPSRTRAGLAG